MTNKTMYTPVKYLCTVFFSLMLNFIYAQEGIPPAPNPPRLVNDYTGILSPNQIYHLEQKLTNYNDTTSTQIVIVLISSLQGYDMVEFAERLGESWGVGKAEHDNGLVILVKPKTAGERGQVHIATGYGLEGAIPDAIAKRIVEKEMIPYFQQNDYYAALDKSTTVLMELAAGEYTAEDYKKFSEGSHLGFLVPLFAILFFLFLTRQKRSTTVGSGSLPFWTFLFLAGGFGRGHYSGSWDNFSRGSGGGFGGFGGGSFGGGGAGGSW